MLQHCWMVVLNVPALEVQKRSLEQLAENRVEHVLKESEAKYESELVREVCVGRSSPHVSFMIF